MRVVKIDGRIVALIGSIIIDDSDPATHRAWLEVLLPFDSYGHHIADVVAGTGIECIDLQAAQGRRFQLHPWIGALFLRG
jgi:hypothetical protein